MISDAPAPDVLAVSVVIPTRNRPASLARALASLSAQSRLPKEVIIVDSSDEPLRAADLPALGLRTKILRSNPSVCRQRNIGISAANGDYILLLDDDIEIPGNYIEQLAEHAAARGAGAVSGLVMQEYGGQWIYQYPVTSFRRLLFVWLFQTGVWGEIDRIAVPAWAGGLYRHILRFYKRRRNTLSLAGWPLLTDFAGSVVETNIYGLGASLIKKEWLEGDPFDEILDPHGIGDNYGVAAQFRAPIQILTALRVRHHLSSTNRLPPRVTYFRRLLALHYFLRLRLSRATRIIFLWSLCGNLLMALFRNRARIWPTAKAMLLIVSGRNPYLVGREREEKSVRPEL